MPQTGRRDYPCAQARVGGTVLPTGSPAEFGAFIAAETEKWAKVVQFAGIKPDYWGRSSWLSLATRS